MTTVENKIPSISNLVKKTDYDRKVGEIEKKLTDHNHDKYITITEFNKLTTDAFNARIAQANLVKKMILMINYQILVEKLYQIKQKTYLLQTN